MKKLTFLIALTLILAACAPSKNLQSQGVPAQVANPPATQQSLMLPQSTQVQVPAGNSQAVPNATSVVLPNNGKNFSNKKPATATAQPPTTAPSGVVSSGKIPNFDHIVMIVLENQDYVNVVGSPNMPNFNALAKKYVLLTQDHAVRHPSLPNYIALISGDTQGISSDCKTCFVNAPNLADLIEASGRTWKTYQEDMPSACFVGDSHLYAQKHDPFMYFDSIRLNPARCDQSVVPMTQLDSDLAANKLPNFAFVMPNLCNSGHNCSPQTADQWLGQMVSKLQASPALGSNSLIIVTFDEGSTHDTSSCCNLGKGGGRVATLLISPLAKAGFSDSTPYSHYSILKTILLAWNLPGLGFTKQASIQPITVPWQ